MTRKKTSIAALVSAGIAAGSLVATAASAAEWRNALTVPTPWTIEGSVGARYWYGWGKTGKNLFDQSHVEISRLTYRDLQSHAVEGFARVDVARFWFVKGYVGGGGFGRGWLNDEDFGLPVPPFAQAYSSTSSTIVNSSLFYGSVDLGMNVIRGGDFRIGAFAGYHYLHERTNAFGCQQLAGNTSVCTPQLADTIASISQDNTWQSLRLGIDGQTTFAERWTINFDAAALPYVWMSGQDSHWLRIGSAPGDFSAPIDENGNGWGYQLEASLSYAINPTASIGAGVRYWHMQVEGTGTEHFVGAGDLPLPIKWQTDILGIFVQGSIKFGPY